MSGILFCHTAILLFVSIWTTGHHPRVPVPMAVNQRPIVQVSHAPLGLSEPSFYVWTLRWSAHDPDGRVVAYTYAVDPPVASDADTAWVRTTRTEETLLFANDPHADRVTAHTFVLKAIDDRGLASAIETLILTPYGVSKPGGESAVSLPRSDDLTPAPSLHAALRALGLVAS